MDKRGKAGLFCIALGLLCLIGALGLWQNNRSEAREAEENSRSVMEQLAPAINEIVQNARDEEKNTDEPSPPADPTMSTIVIEGNRYIGFLSIPDLDLELPVMDSWDYEKLKICPCRYTGTLQGNDLVIAAHNYLRHFGHLMELSIGAEVLFTDAEGGVTQYTVADMEVLQPGEVERLTENDYDLTLFTCNYGGATRFAVRCLYLPDVSA